LICLELAKVVKRDYPDSIVGLFYDYPRGEIDVYRKSVRLSSGLWVADYEVKSHDCPRSRDKAIDQLQRAKKYWHNEKGAFIVDSYFVFSERNEDKFSVVPLFTDRLDFNIKRTYDLNEGDCR